MKIVGDAHEELGQTVSSVPIYVRMESASAVDMQIVDLPGFRDFALDFFMNDRRNVLQKIELLFAEAIGPVLCSLQHLKDNTHKREPSTSGSTAARSSGA